MSAIVLPKRFYNQPQGAVQIDWSHQIFKSGSTVVIHGNKTWVNGIETAQTTQAGSFRITPNSEGIVLTNNASSWRILSKVLTTRHITIITSNTILYTRRGAGEDYWGTASVSNTGVNFGNGGFVGSSSRRSWSWPAAKKAIAIVPDVNIASAPVVYTDGALAIVSSAGGTADAYAWGDSVTYNEIGWNTGNIAYAAEGTHRVGLAIQTTNTSVSPAVLASLSANPWQICKVSE